MPDLEDPAYAWMRDRPGRFGILELPDWPSLGGKDYQYRGWRSLRYMLASKAHGQHLVNGTGRIRPFLWRRFRRTEFWSDDFFGFIAAYFPADYVLVHEGGIPPRSRAAVWARLEGASDGWVEVFRSAAVRVYTIDRSFGRGSFIDRLFLRREIAPRASVSFSARVDPEAGEGRGRTRRPWSSCTTACPSRPGRSTPGGGSSRRPSPSTRRCRLARTAGRRARSGSPGARETTPVPRSRSATCRCGEPSTPSTDVGLSSGDVPGSCSLRGLFRPGFPREEMPDDTEREPEPRRSAGTPSRGERRRGRRGGRVCGRRSGRASAFRATMRTGLRAATPRSEWPPSGRGGGPTGDDEGGATLMRSRTLTLRSLTIWPSRSISSVHGTARRQRSVATMSDRRHLFRCFTWRSRASRIGCPARSSLAPSSMSSMSAEPSSRRSPPPPGRPGVGRRRSRPRRSRPPRDRSGGRSGAAGCGTGRGSPGPRGVVVRAHDRRQLAVGR